MQYFFLSFASLHSGKNLGCCIVQLPKSANECDINEACMKLGIIPMECHNIKAFGLSDRAFLDQGMELNRMYSKQEMIDKGF